MASETVFGINHVWKIGVPNRNVLLCCVVSNMGDKDRDASKVCSCHSHGLLIFATFLDYRGCRADWYRAVVKDCCYCHHYLLEKAVGRLLKLNTDVAVAANIVVELFGRMFIPILL